MTACENRIPPPVIGALLAWAMWHLAAWGPSLGGWAWRWPTALFVALGVAVDLAGLWAFWRARTTVNPLRPERASALVEQGIYRHTRNPMYLGMLCLLCGWAVALGAALPWLGPLLFVAFITRFQIVPEERALRAHFGADYEAYCQRVRRWL